MSRHQLISRVVVTIAVIFFSVLTNVQAAQITCVQCETLFGNDSTNRYRQTLDQSTLNTCSDGDAKVNYTACQRVADDDKTACRTDCQTYLEGPCYGECQDNYNQCLTNCAQDYNGVANTCVNILLDRCFSSCLSQCANPCANEVLALASAEVQAEIACRDVLAPGRLLAPDAKLTPCEPDPNLVSLCADRERDLNEATATLTRAEAQLAALTAERQGFNFKHPNESQDLADLEREYEAMNLDGMKQEYDRAREEFSNIKLEANLAWYQAIAGTAGPFGVIADGLGWIFSFASEKDNTQQAGGAAIMVIEEYFDVTGGFVGAAYDGIELQEFKNKTAAAEKRFFQTRDWYHSARTLLNAFKRRGAYDRMLMLQKKVPADGERLTMIGIEISSLEKQIPVMRHTRDIAQELFDRCQKDLKDACEAPDRETRCREALLAQQSAERSLTACQEKN